MSQFLLLIGHCQEINGLTGVQISQVQQEQAFLARVAGELFPTASGNCWTVTATETGSTDTLFTEAQRLMYSEIPLEMTRLGRVLVALVECAQSVVLWYGNDWRDLAEVEDVAEFVAQIEHQILEPSCEIYLRFENKRKLSLANQD